LRRWSRTKRHTRFVRRSAHSFACGAGGIHSRPSVLIEQEPVPDWVVGDKPSLVAMGGKGDAMTETVVVPEIAIREDVRSCARCSRACLLMTRPRQPPTPGKSVPAEDSLAYMLTRLVRD
jgi:hypothetical protein